MAKEVRDQALDETQDMGSALLWAEVKFGEMLKAIPDKKASSGGGTRSLPERINKKQSHQAQQLANNQDLIEEVIKEAEEHEEIPTQS